MARVARYGRIVLWAAAALLMVALLVSASVIAVNLPPSILGRDESYLTRADQLAVPAPSQVPAPEGAGVQPHRLVQFAPRDGPGIDVNPNPHKLGDVTAGRQVFRFETFGNEGFWTRGLRWPQGVIAARVTPLQALRAGLLFNTERIEPRLLAALAREARTDLSPARAPLLHTPAVLIRLIETSAVVGVPAKDMNGDGRIRLARGDGIGVTCAICHTVTDNSVLKLRNGGAIGRVVDGPAALVLDMGQFLAWGANSRAYYPNVQIGFPLGITIGRGPRGLTAGSSEADFDRYLTDKRYFPRGTFDETQDGVGNSVVNQPLFRQDLAAPWGSSAEFRFLDNISNGSYTQNLDPTTLDTPGGREFLRSEGGLMGWWISRAYRRILRETKVTGYPFVQARVQGRAGEEENQVRLRVDERKLADLSAYISALPAPRGARVDSATFAHGRQVFRANCTACHNVDQGRFVPPLLVRLDQLWPGYRPTVLSPRAHSLTDIQNSPGTFDDKLVVADGSQRGDPRGVPMPLLLDLARKNVFLHDASVYGLENLFHPPAGAKSPHPFYVRDARERAALVAYLRGLDTERW